MYTEFPSSQTEEKYIKVHVCVHTCAYSHILGKKLLERVVRQNSNKNRSEMYNIKQSFHFFDISLASHSTQHTSYTQ